MVWGRARGAAYRVPPNSSTAPLFTLSFDLRSRSYRGFMMLVALAMLLAIYLLLTRTRIGLVIQAALTHPQTVEALGHNVPRVFMLVFGGGCALAGLAGVIGGIAFVTEPAMAASVGPIVFVVVVVGGMGSLAGAFLASLLIGVHPDLRGRARLVARRHARHARHRGRPRRRRCTRSGSCTLAQVAPVLPYLLLVLMLIFRPKGLLGTRDGLDGARRLACTISPSTSAAGSSGASPRC